MAQDLKFKLDLDTDQFRQRMTGATSSLSSFKTAIASGFGAASGMGLLSTVTAGIGKAADFAKEGLRGMFDFLKDCSGAAGEVEMVSARLRTFTASAKLSAEAAEQVDKFAQTPPFGLDAAEAAAKALLKSGTAVNNLTGEMNVLGNVAAAGGLSLETMAAKYSMAHESGIVSMRELRELAQGGIPIFETLAKVVGLPKEELKAALGEGRITFANFKAALNELGGEGKQFGKAMEEVGNTLPGKIMTLQGKWDDFKQTLGAGVNDALSPFIDKAIDGVQRLTGATAAGMEIVKSAYAQGNLGDLVAVSLKYGFAQGINYGAGSMKLIGEVLLAGVTTAGEFLDKIMDGGKMEDSFYAACKGAGIILMDGINLAGIKWSKFLYQTGPIVGGALFAVMDNAIAKLASVMGLEPEETYSARQYKDMIIDQMGLRSTMKNLDAEAEANKADMKDQLQALKAPVGNMAAELGNTISDSFLEKLSQIKFGKIDLIDTTELEQEVKDLLKAINPKAFEELMSAFQGNLKKGGEQTAKLAGASAEMTKAANDKAAEAAKKLAKAMDDAAILAAKAAGNYQKSAELEYKKKFEDKVQEYKDGNMSDAEAKRRANEDIKNEARAARRMKRPGEQERIDRANDRVDRRAEKDGYLGILKPAGLRPWQGGTLIGDRGPLIGNRGPLIGKVKTDLSPLQSPEARKNDNATLKETVVSIFQELTGIRSDLKKITVV